MPLLKLALKNIFIISISTFLSIASFLAGYYQRQATEKCDPFQIIKDTTHQPYPSISSLLKNN